MSFLLAGVMGAVIGSFLNVVAHRLPRRESLIRPGSHCPACDSPVRPYDNVPIFSWLMLRGRCRSCAGSISARYPIVEAVTAALYLACLARFGPGSDVLGALLLVTLLVPVTVIDLDHRLIPNRLLAPAALAALGVALALDPGSLPERLIAATAAGGLLLVAALIRPDGMGMGDVKLAAVLGLFLGREVGAAMLVALLAGSLVGLAIIARKGAAEGRRTAVPFGPFLALGGLVGLFSGDALVDWYLRAFVA